MTLGDTRYHGSCETPHRGQAGRRACLSDARIPGCHKGPVARCARDCAAGLRPRDRVPLATPLG